MIKSITVQEFKKLQDNHSDFCLVDVREPYEYEQANLGGKLIPLNDVPHRLTELNPEQLTIVHCKMGGRSSRAVAFLEQQGFKNVMNLQGGIFAWAEAFDKSMLDHLE